MGKIRIKKILLLIAIFFVVISICLEKFSFIADATNKIKSNSKTVRVGFPISEGLTEIDETGNYKGYTYEYLQTIGQFTNWNYEFVQVTGSEDEQLKKSLTMLQNGEIDLLGCIVQNENTEQMFDFPNCSYGTAYSTLSSLETNTNIGSVNFDVIARKGIKIAVPQRATKRIEALKSYCETNGYNYTLYPYDNYDEIIKALFNKEVDVILGVDLKKEPGTKIVTHFAGIPYYLASTEGRSDIINELNIAMQKQEHSDPYLQKRLYEKYFGEQDRKFFLTDEEKELIEKKPPLNVLIATDAAPFQYKKKKNEYSGISLSVLSEIAHKTGFRFKYNSRNIFKSLEDNITEKNIDLVVGVPNEYSFANANNLILSNPYVFTETTIFAKRGFDINKADESILALPRGASQIEYFGSKNLIYYNTLEDCIKAVNNGEADYGYGNSYSTNYYVAQGVYGNTIIMQLPGMPKTFCFGFTEPLNVDTFSIINRAIATYDQSKTYGYLISELEGNVTELSVWEYIKINPLPTIALILSFIIIIILIILYLIRTSQKQHLLEAQNKAKVVFLSNMSHEMRTPLSAIIGLVGIQKYDLKGNEIQEAADCADKIESSARHLLAIINDILDISKINAGKLLLSERQFDIYNMLSDLETIYKVNALQNDIIFYSKVTINTKYELFGDDLRIKQVLINLISNAIKYNKKNGEVYLIVKQVEESSDTVTINFSVKDTGQGIEDENLKRIFTAFEREERTSFHQGTGLGLTISHNIVNLMGSELNVKSKIDEGSEFYFTLILKKTTDLISDCKAKKEVSNVAIDLSNANILVAEDNSVNALIVKKLLTTLSAKVDIAVNGKICFEQFLNSKPGFYDLILMDIRMPIMDGLEATKAIRSSNHIDAKTIPIIALSANAFDEDYKKSHDVEMNAHLSKPIEPQLLYSTISNLINKKK